MVQPRAARAAARRRCAAGWTPTPARRLSLRDRGPVPAAGARARRDGRAAAVARRRSSATSPDDAYEALVDGGHARSRPSRCRTGEKVQVSYAPLPRAARHQPRPGRSRRAPSRRTTSTFAATLNTYAALYNGVLQRDWFQARARGYATTLDAALTATTSRRRRREPDRDDARRHRAVAPLPPAAQARARARRLPPLRRHRSRWSTTTEHYPYHEVRRLDRRVGGAARRRSTRRACGAAFAGAGSTSTRTTGKRSGAYSAPVYGVHPYMLMNYNDTLDAVFTLAHEMGHSMHTMLSHETQPFVYSGYTIFVAEVPSTLSEALLLDYMLARATDPRERDRAAAARHRRHHRHVLHARCCSPTSSSGAPAGRARRADHGRGPERALRRPADATTTATRLTDDPLSRVTWARIPHFFGSPYYVYQYATCFASSARLLQDVRDADPAHARETASRAILDLLRAGRQRPPDGAAAARRRRSRATRRRSAPSAACSTGSSDQLEDALERPRAVSESRP